MMKGNVRMKTRNDGDIQILLMIVSILQNCLLVIMENCCEAISLVLFWVIILDSIVHDNAQFCIIIIDFIISGS